MQEDQAPSLEQRVRTELRVIRKSADGLTVAALAHSPVICGLLGNGDPHLAYNSLKSAILSATADTSLRAVTSSLGLTSDQRTHLARLNDFGTEHGYDQRQVRRYSDRGIEQLARLITTSWSVESVPCLDVFAYQTGPDDFAFNVDARWQHYMEMQPVQATLYRGTQEPEILELPTTEREDDIWHSTRLSDPIQLAVQAETSIVWVWRGELWPKFSLQWRTATQGHGLTSEMLGNKLMVRVLPSADSS